MHKQKKLPPGLIWRGNTIHMNTSVGTEDLRGPTGTNNPVKAKVFLEKKKVKTRERQEQIQEMKHSNLTVPPEMLGKTYGDAVKLYFKKTNHKDRVEEKAKIERMKWCLPLETPLNDIHDSTIEPFIQEKISQGCKANTINDYKQFVGQILNTAMLKEDGGVFWRTRQHNLTREKTSDNVIPEMDVRIGYVLSWEEQDRLLAALPEHLRDASLYALNTGARMSEIANLRWEWEIYFKDLDVKAFRIPAKFHKNKKPKLVVLNSIAKEIIERNRGKHPERVFSFKGKPVRRFNSTSFQRIRRLPKVDLAHVVFHDFRTTFSTRLGGYEVSKDTISILMGHTIKGITADYAFRTHSVELLLAAVDKLVARKAFTFVPAHENTFRTNPAQPFEYIETTIN
tara:strand:- start:2095 stop:3285 length:1191 start_codon:yes stop_codon:yes gene_type:complete